MIIGEYVTKSHWLFGASTYLIDRIVPAVEPIRLPPAISAGGTISAVRGQTDVLAPTRTGLRAARHRLRPDQRRHVVDGPVVDLRWGEPENWSHALMTHLPLVTAATPFIGRMPTVVLPFRTPLFVHSVFETIGYTVVKTDWTVEGQVWDIRCDDLDCLKQATSPIMKDAAVLLNAAGSASSADLPTRIFVARKGTRAIRNHAQIEEKLTGLGYTTIYPEEHPIADQFRLFDRATHIVGIHGAGLSPICYRATDRPQLQFVEILPAAHMTNFFRVAADQIGATYAAVRGRITVADAGAAYGKSPYFARSLDQFEVDPDTVDMAIAAVE